MLRRRKPTARKTPMPTRKKPLRKKRLAAPPPYQERFADGKRVYFDEVREWLPKRSSDWPKTRVVQSTANRQAMRNRGFCFLCNFAVRICGPLDVHHICSEGGRSDDLCNLMPLCRGCHERIQHATEMDQEVLRAKWTHDRANCDWVRVTALRGSWWPFESLE